MIAAGMVTRPAIHPTPKSCRRRRYESTGWPQSDQKLEKQNKNATLPGGDDDQQRRSSDEPLDSSHNATSG